MSWILTILRSSIGKKYIMAVSGACLSFFLLSHLIGNSVSFLGKEAYNSYASHLHSIGFLTYILEPFLLFVFLVHILTGITLFIENLSARPNRYAVPGNERNWSASTMPYTGIIILTFLLVHLLNFHFITRTVSTAELVRTTLSNPFLASFYLFSLSGLTLHASHGFWSLFQSLGINHPKYNKFLQQGGLATAVIIGTIFILIPLLIVTTDSFLQ
ncbi:MAG: succinate dehydrogenase cytochrome b subunit [Proteobacteria bacterium]|nr:succinate dehydrogenase cytochrome b subunit [Pseudomonadota bacterium]MBU1648052.1 succinate dehydrogenase cytochrome b subunit [Pseudomonadota bacterium]